MKLRLNISTLVLSGVVACALSFGIVDSALAAGPSKKASLNRLTSLMKSLGMSVDTSKDPNFSFSGKYSVRSTAANHGCKNCSTPADVMPGVSREISSDDVVDASAKKDIIGTDDRRALTPEEEKDFSGIGVLECQNDKLAGGKFIHSTGSVVMQDNIVLVSAHGFWAPNNQGRYDPVRDCRFVLLNASAEIIFKSNFSVFSTGNVFETGPKTEASDDWAILRLNTSVPYGTNIFGYRRYSVADANKKIPITLVGTTFHKGSAKYRQKTISAGCSVWQVKNDVVYDPAGVGFLHDCDTEGGMSGSPLLNKTDGIYYVIGIHDFDAGGMDKGKYNRGVRMDNSLYSALAAATAQGVAVSK